ncbi:MAG: hypothetical protein K6G15_04840 [Desulfovibrio sp.]|nr:hypothetical protein [Desulfovibrio sp.]
MIYPRYFPDNEYMTIWQILQRWQKIPLQELMSLINWFGGSRPKLPPHVMWPPAEGTSNARGAYLYPLGRVELKIVGKIDGLCRIEDNDGVIYSCSIDTTPKKHCEPVGELYFLASDVVRLEQ